MSTKSRVISHFQSPPGGKWGISGAGVALFSGDRFPRVRGHLDGLEALADRSRRPMRYAISCRSQLLRESALTMPSEVRAFLIAFQLRASPDVAETDRSPVARFIQTSEHDDILILLHDLAAIDAGPTRTVFRLTYIALPGRRGDMPISRALPIRLPSARSGKSRRAG